MSESCMVVRPARAEDVEGMYRLAAAAGPGLTNLPPDRGALAERIALSVDTLSGAIEPGQGEVRLVLEDGDRLLGVAAIWPRVGQNRPFYSYQIGELSHVSRSTDRRVVHRMLNLVSSLSGASEVGGLLLDPAERGRGAGKLLTKSRYLFIALHRDMFADRIFAELRGYQDSDGRSPFWEAVGRHFYDMDFEEADRLSGIPGHPLIEELSPKYPIYINMLPQDAQDAINRPHDDGRAALAILLAEGFPLGDYVDIFDAGPTLTCATAQVVSISQSRKVKLMAQPGANGISMLAARGDRESFRCTITQGTLAENQASVERQALKLLEIGEGAEGLVLPL